MTLDDPTGSVVSDPLPVSSTDLLPPAEAPPREMDGDPTETATTELSDEVGRPIAPGPVIPIPIPIRFRNVSGSYQGVSGAFRLDLRVDVDGNRPMNRLSGDFIATSGSTQSYLGSFVVDAVTVANTPSGKVIRGLGRYTFQAGAPVVQVTIPRRTIFQPAAPATVQFFTASGAPGAAYLCTYASAYFRSLTLQTQRVSDVPLPVFAQYNTGALPSGGPARTLSVVGAYAEAGVQIVPVPAGPVVDIAGAGADKRWSNAELMASMERNFARYRTAPHWDMWQIACQDHEFGPGLYGIMFDSNGRQGCAVFYRGIGGTTDDKLRLQLYTHVHELGHCFNMMHSWQKSLARPPGVDNPGALSWMNYPWNFPGGPNAFWQAFPFQYVDAEIVHLRHAFRNTIIPSANPFTVGAGLIDPDLLADPISDASGLDFSVASAHGSYALGEPVVVTFRLRTFDRRGKVVHDNLNPRTSGVSLAVAQPDGRTVLFEPLVDHLVPVEPRLLSEGEQLADSAYVGFDKNGLLFDKPGSYKVRAVYHALDGSRVMSNVETFHVRSPASEKDSRVTELILGEEQGKLFALRGSDAESLSAGNAAFERILNDHAKHPLADYVRLAVGVNSARTFKTIDPGAAGAIEVRKPELDRSRDLLTAAAAETSRVDGLIAARALDNLAAAYGEADDKTAAASVRKESDALRASHRGP